MIISGVSTKDLLKSHLISQIKLNFIRCHTDKFSVPTWPLMFCRITNRYLYFLIRALESIHRAEKIAIENTRGLDFSGDHCHFDTKFSGISFKYDVEMCFSCLKTIVDPKTREVWIDTNYSGIRKDEQKKALLNLFDSIKIFFVTNRNNIVHPNISEFNDFFDADDCIRISKDVSCSPYLMPISVGEEKNYNMMDDFYIMVSKSLETINFISDCIFEDITGSDAGEIKKYFYNGMNIKYTAIANAPKE